MCATPCLRTYLCMYQARRGWMCVLHVVPSKTCNLQSAVCTLHVLTERLTYLPSLPRLPGCLATGALSVQGVYGNA